MKNHVDVNEAWEWKSDAAIKEDVESELFWSPTVDSENIIVTVKDGEPQTFAHGPRQGLGLKRQAARELYMTGGRDT